MQFYDIGIHICLGLLRLLMVLAAVFVIIDFLTVKEIPKSWNSRKRAQ